jgi:hypothetical protein
MTTWTYETERTIESDLLLLETGDFLLLETGDKLILRTSSKVAPADWTYQTKS